MIGKVIGFIIVIVLFLGILYSVGNNQENGQEQGGEEQGGQEQDGQQQGSQEEEQEQGGQEEEQEQVGQEQGGQQQGSQENTESVTESESFGIVEMDNEDFTYAEGPQVHVSGIVKNIGNKDAKNVIIEITFSSDRGMWLGKKEFAVGDIAAGEEREYKDELVVGTPDHIHTNSKVFWDQ